MASKQNFFMAGLSMDWFRGNGAERFWLRDQSGRRRLVHAWEAGTKKPSFHKMENEGIRQIPPKTDWRTGLILLFAEKRPDTLGADECNQTGILTSASDLAPAFPDFRPVALGVCSRYSGAT